MSFFNKIIDKAKHGAHLHHHHHHQSDSSLPASANNNDHITNTSNTGEDTKLGIHTPHSSTCSAEQHNQQQQQNKAAAATNTTMTPSNNNTAAAGYVTPRASVDKPSTQSNDNAVKMEVDSGKYLVHFL